MCLLSVQRLEGPALELDRHEVEAVKVAGGDIVAMLGDDDVFQVHFRVENSLVPWL